MSPEIIVTSEEVGERNRVLRNTYQLLSMTMAFSAVCSYFGMHMTMGLGLYLVLVVASFGLLFAIRAFKDSAFGIVLVFAFTGIEGLTLGPVINHYLHMRNGTEVVMEATGLTALAFIGLSAYALITKRDFNYLAGFLFSGLLILLGGMLMNAFFIHSSTLQTTMAAVSALVFSGYILYDTSRIINGGEDNYLMATISLYLDLINLFLALLRILSVARR
jgi:modulator of FtsH protease